MESILSLEGYQQEQDKATITTVLQYVTNVV
jgi:hypothetical protein